MKKLIIIALLAVGFSSFAQDQSQPGQKWNRENRSPEQRAQAQLKRMTSELNLDAKQQEQMKSIIAEQISKREAMMAERMANKDNQKKMTAEEREAFKKSRTEEKVAMENKIKAILTPDQFKKMKDNEAANMEKMRQAREARESRDNKPQE